MRYILGGFMEVWLACSVANGRAFAGLVKTRVQFPPGNAEKTYYVWDLCININNNNIGVFLWNTKYLAWKPVLKYFMLNNSVVSYIKIIYSKYKYFSLNVVQLYDKVSNIFYMWNTYICVHIFTGGESPTVHAFRENIDRVLLKTCSTRINAIEVYKEVPWSRQ